MDGHASVTPQSQAQSANNESLDRINYRALTRPQLNQLCKERGLSSQGKQIDLIFRLEYRDRSLAKAAQTETLKQPKREPTDEHDEVGIIHTTTSSSVPKIASDVLSTTAKDRDSSAIPNVAPSPPITDSVPRRMRFKPAKPQPQKRRLESADDNDDGPAKAHRNPGTGQSADRSLDIGEYSTLNRVQLNQLCIQRKLPWRGRIPDLVRRLEAYDRNRKPASMEEEVLHLPEHDHPPIDTIIGVTRFSSDFPKTRESRDPEYWRREYNKKNQLLCEFYMSHVHRSRHVNCTCTVQSESIIILAPSNENLVTSTSLGITALRNTVQKTTGSIAICFSGADGLTTNMGGLRDFLQQLVLNRPESYLFCWEFNDQWDVFSVSRTIQILNDLRNQQLSTEPDFLFFWRASQAGIYKAQISAVKLELAVLLPSNHDDRNVDPETSLPNRGQYEAPQMLQAAVRHSVSASSPVEGLQQNESFVEGSPPTPAPTEAASPPARYGLRVHRSHLPAYSARSEAERDCHADAEG